MREKNKNRTIIAIVQIDVAKYTINYPFVGYPYRMAFFEVAGCHLVQITMKFLKTIKMLFSGKKKL